LRIRQDGHVERMGNKVGTYRILVGRPEEKGHLEDIDPDDRIILKWIFKNWDGNAWTGMFWQVLGASECGNETLGTIKYGDLLASQELLSCTQSWR